jgi:uncharacterized protein YbjT (DUF2867 family)
MNTPKKIAVAGATGRVGRHTVDVLRESGHEVISISRSHGIDVITGSGLADAMEGVDFIIDAATGPSPDRDVATEFFTTSSRNLHAAGSRAGAQRIVVVSIVGIDKFTGGYQAAKLAHERVMSEGPVPVRILRATQFHEFVPQLIEWGRQGDVSYLQNMRTQLVAARSVAEVLADLAVQSTPSAKPIADAMWEVAGPRVEDLVSMAELYVARRNDPVRIVGVTNTDDSDPALFESGVESGALLPGPRSIITGPTFEQWLDSDAFAEQRASA